MPKKRLPPCLQRFYANANLGLAPELKAELERIKKDKIYIRAMNCSTVDKLDEGEHKFVPVPKSVRKKFLDFGAANMYLTLGAKIVVDEQSHRRVIVSGKVYHGDVTNAVFEEIQKKKRLLKSPVNGTYKTVYVSE